MTDEEAKSRRSRSVSFNAQSSYESSTGSGVDDVFLPKRNKATSTFFIYCKHLDPFLCIFRMLRFIWQRAVTVSEAVFWQLKRIFSRCHGNLRWFLQSYPPMVLFCLSILLFAVLLTLLAVYVSMTTTLNKVDESQDWNVFLQSLANLEFCVIQDNSSIPLPGEKLSKNNKKKVASPDAANVRSVSVKMSLTIYPTKDFVLVPHSLMHLSTSMVGKYIGLKGDEGKEQLNITTIVPYHWNTSSCSSIPLQGCQVVELEACVELTAPKNVFPVSNQKPKACPMPGLSKIDYWAKMNWQVIDVDSVYYCRSRTMIAFRHEHDPRLYQPLKKPHRSIIRQHLLHTSFFLYIFVVIVVIYAVIFNHAKQTGLSQLENPVYDC